MLKLLTTKQVLEMLDICECTFIKMKKEHGFPQPIPLTTKGYRYSLKSIEQWLISQQEKQQEKVSQSSNAIKELVKPKKKATNSMSFLEFELLNGAKSYGTANII